MFISSYIYGLAGELDHHGRIIAIASGAGNLGVALAPYLSGSLIESGGYKPYVERSVKNAWRDQLTRQSRMSLFTDLQTDDSPTVPERLSPSSENADSLSVVDEFRASLSPTDRDVLRELENGHNDREIAELLTTTRHTVRTSVAQIRQRARAYFGEDAPPLPGSST